VLSPRYKPIEAEYRKRNEMREQMRQQAPTMGMPQAPAGAMPQPPAGGRPGGAAQPSGR
jgi:hypothetical protein